MRGGGMAALKLNPGIGFYAIPEEMAVWIQGWVQRYRPYYVFARNFGKYAEVNGIQWDGDWRDERLRDFSRNFPKYGLRQEAPWDDLAAVTDIIRSYEEVLFRLEPIELDVPSINHFPVHNRDLLHFNLP